MFGSGSSKKRFTSEDEFSEDSWEDSWEDSCRKDNCCKELIKDDWCKEPIKDDCGCNVSINIYCNKCKKDYKFEDDDFEFASKKGPIFSDDKCSVYVNIFCNSK